jgi:zinc protease
VVELRLSLRFGNEQSLKGLTTVADLLGPLMRRGTKHHDRQQLTDELDKLGAQLGVSSDAGLLSVTLHVKKPNLAAALKLVREILREPAFPEKEFEILKRENRERYTRAKTEPAPLASRMLQRKLTPYDRDDVRYVPTIEESIARLDAVKLEDVKKLYENQLSGQAGELASVGDFDPDALQQSISDILRNWKSEIAYNRIERPAHTDLKGGKETIETPDKANAIYVAGLVYPLTDSDPEYPALQVGNYLLGGAPLASRLSNRVRGEEGLSYGIGSDFSADPKDKNAHVALYAITNPKNMGKVDSLIAEEVSKFLKDGVSSSELDEGKKAFTEQMKVQRSDDATLASQLATALFAGRTYAYYGDLEKKILDLNPGDVNAAVKKVLDPGKLIIVEAGDFAKK